MIRIRSRDGIECLTIDSLNITISQLKTHIEDQLQVPSPQQSLSKNQNLLLAKTPQDMSRFTDMSNPYTPISSLGLSNGSMIYLAYKGERSISGTLVNPAGSFGRRKMTVGDLIAKQMKVSRQENPHCESISFDRESANVFQSYVNESLEFGVKRSGFMYGNVSKEGKVLVNFIYEPPQQGNEKSVIIMRDSDEEKRDEAIALALGTRKVGFIFTQTVSQGREGYTLSNSEVLQAAGFHGESGLKEWVTVVAKLEVKEDGNADIHFEAFHISDVCIRLFKEGWFETGVEVDPKRSRMKKDVVVGGKDTREVDNNFFLVGLLSSSFPVENRGIPVTMRSLCHHLDRTKGLPFVKRISDFHLLLLLARYLDLSTDIRSLAMCVQMQAPVLEGYQLLIESMATATALY